MQLAASSWLFAPIIFAVGAVVCGLLLPHGAVERDPDAAPALAH